MGHVVPRVMSQYVVEIHVVDFVRCLRGKSLVDKHVLRICQLHLEIVEDGPEPAHRDKARLALILVLKEWLDQESAVTNICAKSLQNCVQRLFLLVIQHVVWVQDGGSLPASDLFCWVFLQVFFRENFFNFLAERDVVHHGWVVWNLEVGLQSVQLRICQLNFLSVQNTSELLVWKVAFPEQVMVL